LRESLGQVDLYVNISGVGSCYPRGQHGVNPPYDSTTDNLLAQSMCNKEPGYALLNVPSISRKTLKAYSLLFSALSILLTRMCKAESVDLPA